ncbi:MAG: hypothetical protein EAZ42_08670 [Verrucomicrobia bacterium]|nr:MAG: hypothetical protein EAZ42_08670 [Verrucomicrobiota bacterium]
MKLKYSLLFLAGCCTAIAAPPANDAFISAIELVGSSPAAVAGTTVAATAGPFDSDNDYFGNPGSAGTVWYKWTAPAGITTARITVTFNGEPGECMVRNGSFAEQIVGGMAQYLSAVKEAGHRSFVIRTTPGEIYRIKIADRNGSSSGGTFSLNLVGSNSLSTPVNDTKSTATVLPSQQNVVVTGSFQNATSDEGEMYYTDNTFIKSANTPAAVWYRWQAPATGKYGINVIGQKYLKAQIVSSADSRFLLYDDLRKPNGFDAVAGQQYHFKVISDVGGNFFSGSFQLILAPTPSRDQGVTYSPPDLAQSLTYQLAGSTPSSDILSSAPAYAPNVPNVYSFLTTFPPNPFLAPGIWEIAGYDPKVIRVTVFREIGNDYAPVATNDFSSVTRFVVPAPNVGYHAELALAYPENALTTAALAGTLTLRQVSASTAPANDAFANATVLSSQPLTTIQGTTIGASGEVLEDYSESGESVTRDIASRSVWYRWTPLANATHYIIALDEENRPLHVRITSGTTLGALTNLGADEELRNTGVLVSASETYNICVDDENASRTGNFRLFIGRPLSFDNFANRQFISNTRDIARWRYGSSLGMTRELEPNVSGIAHTAWFEYTANSTTPLYINTFGSSYDTVLHVFTGTALNNLVGVASNDDFSNNNRSSSLTFTPVSGTSYKIRVAGYSTASGIFALQIGRQPTSWNPYEIWALNYDWMAPERNEMADPDNDGLNNLQECAFGGHPLVREDRRSPPPIFSPNPLPPKLLNPPNFGIQYRVFSENLTGVGIGTPITVIPQLSSDLIRWLPLTPTLDSGISTATATTPSLTNSKIFLRTRVNSTP